jgi:DNA-binding transcriptional MocR family regulator
VCEPDRPRWALLRSVSKSLGPDLRVAILAGDAATVARVEGRQLLGTGWVSRILQQVVVAFWSDPSTRQQLKQVEAIYVARRQTLLEALTSAGIKAQGRSGFNVLLPVGEEAAVVASLLRRGWAVSAMERWRINSPPAIRITTATLKLEEASHFVEDLAQVLAYTPTAYSA